MFEVTYEKFTNDFIKVLKIDNFVFLGKQLGLLRV